MSIGIETNELQFSLTLHLLNSTSPEFCLTWTLHLPNSASPELYISRTLYLMNSISREHYIPWTPQISITKSPKLHISRTTNLLNSTYPNTAIPGLHITRTLHLPNSYPGLKNSPSAKQQTPIYVNSYTQRIPEPPMSRYFVTCLDLWCLLIWYLVSCNITCGVVIMRHVAISSRLMVVMRHDMW